MDKILPYLLCRSFDEKIDMFTQPIGETLISHLLYTNDLVVFASGDKNSVKMIIKFLRP